MEQSDFDLQTLTSRVDNMFNNNPQLQGIVNNMIDKSTFKDFLPEMCYKISQKISGEDINNRIEGATKFINEFDKNPTANFLNTNFFDTDIGKEILEKTENIYDVSIENTVGEDNSPVEPEIIVNLIRNVINEGSVIDMIGAVFDRLNN